MGKKKNFFEKYKSPIEGISSIIQAVTVIILVIVTICYALSTNEMVKIMSDEFEASKIPYLTISKVDLQQVSNGVELNIFLSNQGENPLYIDMLNINFFENNTAVHDSVVDSELGSGETKYYTSTRFFTELEERQLISIKAYYSHAYFREKEFCHETMVYFYSNQLIPISSKTCN